MPEEVKTDELDEIIDWLGETVRQTDSSLLDEWEALTDPESVARVAAAMAAGEASPPPRPMTANTRAFNVMVRNAMFQKIQLASRDDAAGPRPSSRPPTVALTDAPGRVAMGEAAWEAALGAYWEEYESIEAGPSARSPELLMIDRDPVSDPRGDPIPPAPRGSGRCDRSSRTPKPTATSRSRRRSTSRPRTPPESP